MAWYREWFGEEYLELYSHRGAQEAERDVDFVLRSLPGPPRAALDLACGSGRHTAALRRRGIRAIGIDLSLTLLVQCPELPRVEGDMRALPFAAERFDWVLNFFTSFGYFESESENFRVLEEVARVLRRGGWLLIDFLNVAAVLQSLKEKESLRLAGRTVEIERWYDPNRKRLNKRIRVSGDGRPPRAFLESVRAYEPDEVETSLGSAGVEVMARYGNFEGAIHGVDSERLILVGRRAS